MSLLRDFVLNIYDSYALVFNNDCCNNYMAQAVDVHLKGLIKRDVKYVRNKIMLDTIRSAFKISCKNTDADLKLACLNNVNKEITKFVNFFREVDKEELLMVPKLWVDSEVKEDRHLFYENANKVFFEFLNQCKRARLQKPLQNSTATKLVELETALKYAIDKIEEKRELEPAKKWTDEESATLSDYSPPHSASEPSSATDESNSSVPASPDASDLLFTNENI